MDQSFSNIQNLVVVGGGAAGFFAAIAAAEANPRARIVLLERGRTVLQKVRISGGGRCNVTHACFDARELVKNYPRGSRELLAPFLRFGPSQTIEWFERRGVRLKTEADGRMFPVTDDSETIVQCLVAAARNAGVEVRTSARVESIERADCWKIALTNDPKPLLADRLLVATGSDPAVWQLLAALGHRIVPPVPSLFTFNTKDTRLRELAGVSVPSVALRIPGTKLAAEGPLLVTHWGLSGPAILRLSAWGARDLHELSYRFSLTINFLGKMPAAEAPSFLQNTKNTAGKKTVAASLPPELAAARLPLRFWQNLVAAADIAPERRWADLDKKSLLALASQLTEASFQIAGKSTFKEEFVTAGGLDLRDLNFKNFESKICPGLFLAGEVLDVDAITGGFNFQAAWTGGWIAGLAAVTL